jgi:phosphoribosyl 1,2-cyclic phosphate phosphodiesterase
MLSAGWGRCDPANPRNRRSRPSVLVEEDREEGEDENGPLRILIDASPDLRQQLLDADIRRLDALLFTHAHADHTHGLDDLREVNRAMQAPIPCWADHDTLDALHQRFGYCFLGIPEGQPVFRPWLLPHLLDAPFSIGSLGVDFWRQDHGWVESIGYRLGDFAYSTDLMDLPEEAFDKLAGVRVWMIGTLADQPHPTHATVDQALAWMERVRPERGILTHMSPALDYDTLKARLPAHVEPAYDGMIIEI